MPAKLYTIAERPAVRRRILESYSQLSEDDLSAVFPFAQAPLQEKQYRPLPNFA